MARIEQELMRQLLEEIGLGKNPDSYQDGELEAVREQATAKLSQAIQQAHETGKPIVPPRENLCNLARSVSLREKREREEDIDHTIRACIYVIEAHIQAFAARTEEERSTIYEEAVRTIRKDLLPDDDQFLIEREPYPLTARTPFSQGTSGGEAPIDKLIDRGKHDNLPDKRYFDA